MENNNQTYIYTYNFALYPESYQPSGYPYSGSRIDDVTLNFTIPNNVRFIEINVPSIQECLDLECIIEKISNLSINDKIILPISDID